MQSNRASPKVVTNIAEGRGRFRQNIK